VALLGCSDSLDLAAETGLAHVLVSIVDSQPSETECARTPTFAIPRDIQPSKDTCMNAIQSPARRRQMKKILAIWILALAHFFASSIAYAQQAEMQQIKEAMALRASKGEASALKLLFVLAARKGDVEGMMKDTSLITLRIAGEDEIRRIYTEAYIPAFQRFNKDAGECEANEIADPDGTNGWEFMCELTNDQAETMYVRVTVLREGKFVVAAIKFTNAR
jgi:hypothetical protein